MRFHIFRNKKYFKWKGFKLKMDGNCLQYRPAYVYADENKSCNKPESKWLCFTEQVKVYTSKQVRGGGGGCLVCKCISAPTGQKGPPANKIWTQFEKSSD